MLAWRADFGLAQVQEPEQLVTLAELYLTEGWSGFISGLVFEPRRFRTDSNLPGTERLAVVKPEESFFQKPYKMLPKMQGPALR